MIRSSKAPSDLRWLLDRLRPQTWTVLLGLLTAILAGAISTVDPLLMKHLIDTTLPERRPLASLSIVFFLALCFVSRSALNGASGLFSFRATQLLAQDLRDETLRHMTQLSADWHEQTLVGEKLSRIDQDVLQIAQIGAEMANTAVRSSVFVLVNLAIMFSLNAKMTLVTLPLLPLFVLVRSRFRGRIQRRADEAQAEIGIATGVLVEHLGAVPQIQLLTAENDRVARTIGAWLRVVEAQWKQRRTEILFSIAVTSVLASAILLVLGVGVHEYLQGLLTLGSLVAFYTYVTRIFEPVSMALELYSRAQRMLTSAHRVREILLTEPTVLDNGEISEVNFPISKGLVCDSVSFAYRNEDVLHDVSLRIEGGECIAIVGRSGSGKSTLSRLMARIADPTSGAILISGEPASNYSLQALRRAICYVPQQPILFSGTIRENLRIASPRATSAMFEEAMQLAQLGPLMARLPRGLDTIIGPDAAGLSGGERQRLAIARALLRRSPILILDEATSALDLPTEEALFQGIGRFQKDWALILISHRLRSLTWVDRLVVLDGGRVAAVGRHEVLHKSSDLYRTLYDNQVNGEST